MGPDMDIKFHQVVMKIVSYDIAMTCLKKFIDMFNPSDVLLSLVLSTGTNDKDLSSLIFFTNSIFLCRVK